MCTTQVRDDKNDSRFTFYPVGGNVNWCNHYGEQYRGFLKKLKIELPYDLAIPLPGVYLDNTVIQKDTYTPMFIAALFPIAKTWKQPTCPLAKEWIKRMCVCVCVYVYVHIYKWNATQPETEDEIVSFAATWMD